MKKGYFRLSLLLVAMLGAFSTLFAQENEDLIKVPAHGRFNRGIHNYRFIPKGKWMGGVTLSYWDYNSADSRLLFSLLKDFDMHAKTTSLYPFVGYAIKDNMVVGAKLGYSRTYFNLGSLAVNIEDLDVALRNMCFSDDGYTFAAFHRSYVGLDRGKRFGLFNETTLSFSTGTSNFTRGKSEDVTATNNEDGSVYKDTKTNRYELNLRFNPGVSVFIMQNVAAEVSMGIAGFSYRSEKQKNNLGETGSSRMAGSNFKINLFNINIGVICCF